MSRESDEKRELLKLRQGLIEESEIIEQNSKEPPVKLKGFAWLKNYVYHNKWFILAGAFFIAVAVFLVQQVLTKEAVDLRVLLITSDTSKTPTLYTKTKDIELALEKYCPDYDGNGVVHVDVYYIDLTKTGSDIQYMNTNTTKFFAEIDRGGAELIIADRGIFSSGYEEGEITEEEIEEDIKGFYTEVSVLLGDESYAGEYMVQMNKTPLAEAANYSLSCPDVLEIGVRNQQPNMVSYNDANLRENKKAVEVFNNIIKDNKLNINAGVPQ